MKYYMLLVAFCASCFMSFGEFSEKDLKKMKRYVKIGSARASTERSKDKDRKSVKTQVLKFTTTQDQASDEQYVLIVAMELTDKESDEICLAELKRKQPDTSGYEYIGEDLWEFHLPFGEMEKVKTTGFAIQYGIMDGEEFIVLAEEYDDCDTLEELRERKTKDLSKEATVKRRFMHIEDQGEGEETIESLMRTVK